jgi:hypothetical protein
VPDLARCQGGSEHTIYRWRSKIGGFAPVSPIQVPVECAEPGQSLIERVKQTEHAARDQGCLLALSRGQRRLPC